MKEIKAYIKAMEDFEGQTFKINIYCDVLNER